MIERTRTKMYRNKLALPAVWVQYEPLLTKWVRIKYFRPALRIQWRWPWHKEGIRRNHAV